ncbi:MAG: hypothetical protein JO002_03890, partial [Burkholderiaceae bacterium]|nr:hypothetical protein [Burkholderiaceae bacterium]
MPVQHRSQLKGSKNNRGLTPLPLAIACTAAWLWATPALAENAEPNAQPQANQDINPAELPEADLKIQAKPLDQWTGLWTRQNMLGDIGGLRSFLGRYG